MTSEGFYRILLKAYPARYRRKYEEAMAQLFRDQLRAANTRSQRVRLWLRIAADLALSVPARHLERAKRRYLPWTCDNYSERARRAIFYAHYEAASLSGSEISVEDLLLGALREDGELAAEILGGQGYKEIFRAIEAQHAQPRCRPQRNHLSILQNRAAIPLSLDCKRALADAGAEAQQIGARVTTRHLLRAILRQEDSVAARLLRERARDLPHLLGD
jgi:hypothetical protein